MSSFPLVRHKKIDLKALSIADAYADVMALVIKDQFCEPPAPDPYSIPLDITIGRGLCLARSLDTCLVQALKIIDQIETACIKFKTIELSINDENRDKSIQEMSKLDRSLKENQSALYKMLKNQFNDIDLFPKSGKRITITLLHRANTSFNLTLPDLSRIIEPITQIPDIQTLTLTMQQDQTIVKIALLEPVKKMLTTITDQNLQQTNLLAQAGETYYLVQKENFQASRSLESLDDARILLSKVQKFMIERPKLITANQANTNKIKLIQARRYQDELQ